MKKLKLKYLGLSLAGVLSIAAIVSVPLVVTSCSESKKDLSVNNNSSTTQNLIATQKAFENSEKVFLTKTSAGLPIFGYEDPNTSFDGLILNAENAIDALEKYKLNNKLNQNETIWADSYIFQWKMKIENIRSGIIYLGANPITGSRVLSSSSNHISNFVKDAVNIYPLNPETGDPDTSALPDTSLVNSLASRLLDAAKSIEEYRLYMDYGQEKYGYQPSTITKKLLVNQFINFFYQNEVNDFVTNYLNQSNNSITIEKLVQLEPTNNYFSDLIQTIDQIDYLSNEQKNEIKSNVSILKESLSNFVSWYATDYYVDENSYGPENKSTNGKPITLTSVVPSGNDREEEKTIYGNGIALYGLGLTTNDLNQTNIGIGFMKLKNGTSNPFISSSNDVYQQLLFNNNSIDTSAIDIYQQGIKYTKDAMQKMSKIAKLVNEIVVGGINDNTQIYYDADGIGDGERQLVTLGSINNNSSIANADEKLFKEFNVWLNQEDFFWGREYLEGQDLSNFIDKYWTNPQTSELQQYKNIIIQQGYKEHWENATTISDNSESNGTVTGDQALAGAVLSLKDYIDFKVATDDTFDANFNSISDYVISPYNYDIRVDIGVGMEGPRGSCQFQYNCDPYYSLPKWSVSSLTTHEGKMGHHTQQQYWTEYLEGGEGLNNSGPGYSFVNDAFHEGWAVFTEWFANELEIYGTELDEFRMPTNWLSAKGLVPNFDSNNIESLTAKMKELHAGVYYDKAIGEIDSEEKLTNSIKLANMLQYYGFLNEAQLRNMRLALDTAYHHQPSIDDQTHQDSSLPYGASIKQVRDFMTANSALGVGDINSESIRYLVMPSQATGYMLGKIIFEDLYSSVQTKLGINFLDPSGKNEIKKLFDLFLRNGEIPLEVLQEQVIKEYDINVANTLGFSTSLNYSLVNNKFMYLS